MYRCVECGCVVAKGQLIKRGDDVWCPECGALYSMEWIGKGKEE